MFSSRAILRATRAAAPSRIAVSRAAVAPQIRSYATPAAQDSKPPVALYGLDGTYASALVSQKLHHDGFLMCLLAQLALDAMVRPLLADIRLLP